MKVWDLPTRVFHWGIVVLISAAWYTAENGLMEWHYRTGITVLGLITFRLIWGLAGNATARFSNFVRSPKAVSAYLRAKGAPSKAGHNPLGGYSVLAMLAAMIVQVSTGVIAVDIDGIESGPLSYAISFDHGRLAAAVHSVSFIAIQVLVALHIVAIIIYRVRGRRLIVPMITGRDPQLTGDVIQASRGGLVRALAAIAAASTFAWWVDAGAPL